MSQPIQRNGAKSTDKALGDSTTASARSTICSNLNHWLCTIGVISLSLLSSILSTNSIYGTVVVYVTLCVCICMDVTSYTQEQDLYGTKAESEIDNISSQYVILHFDHHYLWRRRRIFRLNTALRDVANFSLLTISDRQQWHVINEPRKGDTTKS